LSDLFQCEICKRTILRCHWTRCWLLVLRVVEDVSALFSWETIIILDADNEWTSKWCYNRCFNLSFLWKRKTYSVNLDRSLSTRFCQRWRLVQFVVTFFRNLELTLTIIYCKQNQNNDSRCKMKPSFLPYISHFFAFIRIRCCGDFQRRQSMLLFMFASGLFSKSTLFSLENSNKFSCEELCHHRYLCSAMPLWWLIYSVIFDDVISFSYWQSVGWRCCFLRSKNVDKCLIADARKWWNNRNDQLFRMLIYRLLNDSVKTVNCMVIIEIRFKDLWCLYCKSKDMILPNIRICWSCLCNEEESFQFCTILSM